MPLSPRPELCNYIRANAGKKTLAQMSIDSRVPEKTIQVYASEMKVSLLLDSVVANRERIDREIVKYAAEKTAKQLSKILGASPDMIRARARAKGIYLVPYSKSRDQKIGKLVRGVEIFNPAAYTNWLVG